MNQEMLINGLVSARPAVYPCVTMGNIVAIGLDWHAVMGKCDEP